MITYKLSAELKLARIKKLLEKGSVKGLFSAGNLMRRKMKASIKVRQKPSNVGDPPHTRGKQVLKKSMQFEVNRNKFIVVVGPKGSTTGGFANVHEFGGRRTIARNARRTKRMVGDSGEIELGRTIRNKETKKGKKANRSNTKRVTDFKGKKVIVTYGKLFTDEQVRRANDFNEELYGKQSYVARFPKRKFAEPVLDATKPALPKLYANIL